VPRPPDEIGPGAPFDVAAFFATPPAELNAAPLYLDALFEFGPEMAVCFLAGAETSKRQRVSERRSKTLETLFFAFVKDPTSTTDNAIDDIVAELEPAVRRVERAQGRPQCVFETGLATDSPLPHAEAARRVARLVVLKSRRCLDRGNVETPLRDLQMVLRLARDLRPRGPTVCQLIATSITLNATEHIIPALLASPAFHDEHGRRLLDLLIRHEAASINGYQEGLRYEYLVLRMVLASAVKDPRGIDKVLGVSDPNPGKADTNSNIIGRMLEHELKMKPSAIAEDNARIDTYFRDLLAFDRPVSQWSSKQPDPMKIWNGRVYSRIALMFIPPAEATVQAQARAALGPRAAECLVALRLWKSHSNDVPSDLETVIKAAGLPRVPIDPYSGEPLHMAIIDSEPVIYSIGKDGRDDGGRIDSNGDRKPGDQTFRLPAPEKRRQ
jgi:hypothetical protein